LISRDKQCSFAIPNTPSGKNIRLLLLLLPQCSGQASCSETPTNRNKLPESSPSYRKEGTRTDGNIPPSKDHQQHSTRLPSVGRTQTTRQKDDHDGRTHHAEEACSASHGSSSESPPPPGCRPSCTRSRVRRTSRRVALKHPNATPRASVSIANRGADTPTLSDVCPPPGRPPTRAGRPISTRCKGRDIRKNNGQRASFA
jgi:hypothetical protein